MSLSHIHSLDYTVLLCEPGRMPETKAFYRDVMGFPVETDSERWVAFRIGAALLTLRPRGTDPTGADDGPAVDGSAAVQLAFRVPPAAVEACHAALVARGVPIVRGPTEIPHARHLTLFFRDPEGNLLEIYAEI
jgi:catechol 2,3-dioxygenase-like lactoylglutathione lyase family enzyme